MLARIFWMVASSASFSGTHTSAATDGVAARTSAAKSASVTSTSWPTADTTGTGQAAMARTTNSSLKAHKSSREPPPRPTMITSTWGRAEISAMPWAISSAAPSPCTWAGRRMICMAGNRRRVTVAISWITAPEREVTTPMALGSRGRGRFFATSNSPSFISLFFRASSLRNSSPTPSRVMDSA